MRLSDFILKNIEPILQTWEDFARSLETPGTPLDREDLRDHAHAMLLAIADDLRNAQSSQQQTEKSKGHDTQNDTTAANVHALSRLLSGFTIEQVVAEFRALRASVIKQWVNDASKKADIDVEDMIRFNEAIDQALARSVGSYTEAVQASRNVFLGILGHDLRTPLGAIMLGADALLRTDDLSARATKITSRIYTSVKRASRIVGDLLDFTRSQLGPGLPVSKTRSDVAPALERVVEELRMVNPNATILLESPVSAIGLYDATRLEQVFSNLIGNAVQHGDPQGAITVALVATDDTLRFTVHNTGAVIPEDVLGSIFNPLDRYSPESPTDKGPHASLGLGLFIASEIVSAHQGHVDVTSSAEAGTVFAVEIPTGAADLPSSTDAQR
ncbi:MULTISPECIES: sensor histidine kinase [Pseudomonas]|uniref:sensor histidine kinase n=1 Tax=Pseudomonas TaxID=286 RepID=UPI00257C0EED|nr:MULTISPECIES: sensor histidine kinase [Pseudomonas]